MGLSCHLGDVVAHGLMSVVEIWDESDVWGGGWLQRSWSGCCLWGVPSAECREDCLLNLIALWLWCNGWVGRWCFCVGGCIQNYRWSICLCWICWLIRGYRFVDVGSWLVVPSVVAFVWCRWWNIRLDWYWWMIPWWPCGSVVDHWIVECVIATYCWGGWGWA
jgi:hypothetical protein